MPLAALNGWGSRGRVEQWSKRSSAKGSEQRKDGVSKGRRGQRGRRCQRVSLIVFGRTRSSKEEEEEKKCLVRGHYTNVPLYEVRLPPPPYC